jgi:ribosomal protein L18
MSYNKNDIKIQKKRLAVRSRRGDANFEIYFKKTNNHFYLVVYNVAEAKEVFCYSTLNIKDAKNNVETAGKVGEEVAKWCLENKIPSIYFNKLKYKFHGKIANAVNAFNSKFNS